MKCTGNCMQGRRPCDCELEADHGEFVSPIVKALENGLLWAIFLVAVCGVTMLVLDQGGFL